MFLQSLSMENTSNAEYTQSKRVCKGLKDLHHIFKYMWNEKQKVLIYINKIWKSENLLSDLSLFAN